MKSRILELLRLVTCRPKPPGPTFEQTMDEYGWAIMARKDIYSEHVIPINDQGQHRVDCQCWCNPSLNDENRWVHVSQDGREEYEAGRLLQ